MSPILTVLSCPGAAAFDRLTLIDTGRAMRMAATPPVMASFIGRKRIVILHLAGVDGFTALVIDLLTSLA